jgi:hypothetical protein
VGVGGGRMKRRSVAQNRGQGLSDRRAGIGNDINQCRVTVFKLAEKAGSCWRQHCSVSTAVGSRNKHGRGMLFRESEENRLSGRERCRWEVKVKR